LWPAPLPVTPYASITVEYDLTLDGDGNGSRHNYYFDFDPNPNKFLGDAQIVQDNGYVQMVRGGNQQNGQGLAGNATYHMRWVFNVSAGEVDTWFGGEQVDIGSAVALSALIGDQPGEDPDGNPMTLDALSMALVSDFWEGPADCVYLDNLVVTATLAVVTGLAITPASIDIYAGGSGPLRAIADVAGGGPVDVTAAATWSSDNPAVATVTAGVVTGIAEGMTVIGAEYQGHQASVGVAVHGALPEPPMTYHPRSFHLSFDPILEPQGGARLHTYAGWNDPATHASGHTQDLSVASHAWVNYRVSHYVPMDAWPLKEDGFRYTDASYVSALGGGGWHMPDGVDYKAIVRDYDLARRVDLGEFDEVMLNGGPYFGYFETRMAGYGGYWCNSPPLQRVACSKIFVLLGYNYERSFNLHSFGHGAESILAHTYGFWDITQDRHDWERFTHNVGQSPNAACGSVHYPPNALSDYDYANPTTVLSTAVDWELNFPNLAGQTSIIGREAWGGPDYERNYLRWWFGHMPHGAGTNNHDGLTRQNSWWRYLSGFNFHSESGGDHPFGGPIPPSAPYAGAVLSISSQEADSWHPRIAANGTMAWSATVGADREIIVASLADPTNVQVTTNAFEDEAPRINATGQLVWQAFDGQDYEIFSRPDPGGPVIQITNNTANDWHPDINDSGRIVWDGHDGSDFEIYSSMVDGSGFVQVTNNSAAGGYPREDVWPRINSAGLAVWVGWDGTDWEIFSAGAAGGPVTNVSDNAWEDEHPEISSAGKVVWHAWLSDSNAEIFSANADGTGQVQLTASDVLDWYPQINSGGRVAWMSRDASGDWEIYRAQADGSELVAVTNNASHDQHPRINDAGIIAWQAFDGEDWEIYRDAGSGVEQVTENHVDDRAVDQNESASLVWHAESAPFGTAGRSEIRATSADPTDAPGGLRSTRLHQNVPNPFNASTTIVFSLRSPARVELVIYDLAGRRIRTLLAGDLPAGIHRPRWNGLDERGRSVASGIYFYQLRSPESVLTRRMVLIR
jgi:hypothetical protein